MRRHNPAFIPRNHNVEEALQAATSADDYSVMERLLDVLATPYDHGRDLPMFSTSRFGRAALPHVLRHVAEVALLDADQAVVNMASLAPTGFAQSGRAPISSAANCDLRWCRRGARCRRRSQHHRVLRRTAHQGDRLTRSARGTEARHLSADRRPRYGPGRGGSRRWPRGCDGTCALPRIAPVGIRPVDPLTFLSCAILLAAIAFLACWLPAILRRGSIL